MKLTFSRDIATSIELSSDIDIALLKEEKTIRLYIFITTMKFLMQLYCPLRIWLMGHDEGYLALESDFKTIIGLEFFDHKETPGLGGEIDNPKWKAIWKGKEIYSDSGDVLISVIKGSVDKSSEEAKYQVDGLSGATITSNGVTNLLSFWLGEMGYGPLINENEINESADV